MPKQKNVSAPSPAKPGVPERSTDTAEPAASKDEVAAESQVASATPDGPEAAAKSPITQDTSGNSDLPEQTADANPSPADPGTAVPTSPQDDSSEAGATKDDYGAESQVPAAPSNTLENNLPLTAVRDVQQSAGLDDGGWFAPVIPEERPAPKPAQKPKPSSMAISIDKCLRSWGMVPTPPDTTPETGLPGPAAHADSGDAEATQPSETPAAPAEAPPPPPRVATATEVFTWIKLCLQARAHLIDEAAEFVAFWVISTWFREALTVYPCLVITGPAHDASRVLHILNALCPRAALLAGFRRGHLATLGYYWTNLIWEPNLDKRTANLLSSLTDRNFLVVSSPNNIARYSKSTAIYTGEDPETHKIQNAIHIHLAPTNAESAASPERVQEMMERLPVHLGQYRNKNHYHVMHWTWNPSCLASEAAVLATALGRCIVDAPELRQKLVTLLKTRDQQRLSELSNTKEAVVVEATRALSRDGRLRAHAQEIADVVNRRFEARGETARLRPGNVGRSLKGLGLPTHELSKAGNGLTFDKATVARIRELAAIYGVDVMEDTPAETENLHSSQTKEKK